MIKKIIAIALLIISFSACSQNQTGIDSNKEEKLNQLIIKHICEENLFKDMSKYIEKRDIYGLSDPPDKELVKLRISELDSLWEKGFTPHKNGICLVLDSIFKQDEDFRINSKVIFEETKNCKSVKHIEYYKSTLNHLLQDIITKCKQDYLRKKTNKILIKIQAVLNEKTEQKWEIKDYPFLDIKLLSGWVYRADHLEPPWNKAGILICSRHIPDIKNKLMILSYSAPFEVIDYSANLQILCWTGDKNLQPIIDIVKKIDSTKE